MKKKLSIIITLFMALGLVLTACANNQDNNTGLPETGANDTTVGETVFSDNQVGGPVYDVDGNEIGTLEDYQTYNGNEYGIVNYNNAYYAIPSDNFTVNDNGLTFDNELGLFDNAPVYTDPSEIDETALADNEAYWRNGTLPTSETGMEATASPVVTMEATATPMVAVTETPATGNATAEAGASSDVGETGETTVSDTWDILRISQLLGHNVSTMNNESMGDIDSVIVDSSNGQIVYAVINADSFLNLGGDLAVVPWNQLVVSKQAETANAIAEIATSGNQNGQTAQDMQGAAFSQDYVGGPIYDANGNQIGTLEDYQTYNGRDYGIVNYNNSYYAVPNNAFITNDNGLIYNNDTGLFNNAPAYNDPSEFNDQAYADTETYWQDQGLLGTGLGDNNLDTEQEGQVFEFSEDSIIFTGDATTLQDAPAYASADLGDGILNNDVTSGLFDYWNTQVTDLPQTGMNNQGNLVRIANEDPWNLVDTTGADMGDIEDMIFQPWDGTIPYVIWSSGGFLGIGDNQVLVPFDKLQFAASEDGNVVVTLPYDQATLQDAPVFDSSIDTSTEGWDTDFSNFWDSLD